MRVSFALHFKFDVNSFVCLSCFFFLHLEMDLRLRIMMDAVMDAVGPLTDFA